MSILYTLPLIFESCRHIGGRSRVSGLAGASGRQQPQQTGPVSWHLTEPALPAAALTDSEVMWHSTPAIPLSVCCQAVGRLVGSAPARLSHSNFIRRRPLRYKPQKS